MLEGSLHYVDPASGGHHGDYLAFFMRLAERHRFVLKVWAPESSYAYASTLAASSARFALHVRDTGQQLNQSQKQALLKLLASEIASGDRLFFAMLDPMLASLALFHAKGLSINAPWSGLLFRTSYNYPQDEPLCSMAHLKSKGKLGLIKYLLGCANPSLLTLDPFWDPGLGVPAHHLPDAMTELDRLAPAPHRVPAHNPGKRKTLLFFGSIDVRKGLLETISALQLATDDQLLRMHLQVLGKWQAAADYPGAMELLENLKKRGLEVTVQNQFVSNHALLEALLLSDIVLAPYLNHIGSSGVMSLAAQFGKPVLTQARYQLGREVRTYALGIGVDTSSPREIYRGIVQLMETGIAQPPEVQQYCNWRNYENALHSASLWLQHWTSSIIDAVPPQKRVAQGLHPAMPKQT
jgi:glycosyltransferase involved in cell wall biosynthesis